LSSCETSSFKIKAADNHCAAALAPTETAKVDVFVEQLHKIGQNCTKHAVVGVLLTQQYSLGACQRGELLGIDRAICGAVKARFPETVLMSVIAHSDYSEERYSHDDSAPFASRVYEASVSEIERIARGDKDMRDGKSILLISSATFRFCAPTIGTAPNS
jgi:hypothetical protein